MPDELKANLFPEADKQQQTLANFQPNYSHVRRKIVLLYTFQVTIERIPVLELLLSTNCHATFLIFRVLTIAIFISA